MYQCDQEDNEGTDAIVQMERKHDGLNYSHGGNENVEDTFGSGYRHNLEGLSASWMGEF